jgi:uncharacterized membrane protein YtjA (UPF0391 family)
MKTTSILFTVLALIAAALGIWVLAGVAAWVIRVAALIFLVMAVLSLRKKVTAPD